MKRSTAREARAMALGQDVPWWRQPVRSLLWPFVILIIVGGWLAVLLQVQSERVQAERAAILKAQSRVILLEQHVIRTLQAASSASLYLGYKFLIQQDLPREAANGSRPYQISDPVIDKALFAGAAVVDQGGPVIAATTAIDGPLNVAGHPIYERQANSSTTDLVVSGPHLSRILQREYIYASRNIFENGVSLGHVSLQMTPSQLLNFPHDAPFDSNDLVSVIGLDGVTLARRSGDAVTAGENVQGRLVMQMQQQSPNGTYLGPSSLDDHVRYFVHRRIGNFPIFVTAGVSRSDAIAPANRRAVVYWVIMGLVSAMGIAVALFVGKVTAERERRTAALGVSLRRLAQAQRVGLIGDWEYEPATDRITMSDQLCSMYERPAGSNLLTSQEFANYVIPGQDREFGETLDQVLNTGEPQYYEFAVQLPSGTISQRSINAVPVKDASGRIVKLYGTDQDIGHKVLLRRLQSKVSHFDRQRAMSMMASTLAHELSQPLTAASSYVSAARRIVGDDGGASRDLTVEALTCAHDQIHSAAAIIRRVRAMVNNEPGEAVSCDVAEVVASTLSLLTACRIARHGLVKAEIAAGIPHVLVDPIQLQQVLVNLVKNAVEAAPPEQPTIVVRASAADGMVQIEVEDNGQGFSQAEDEEFGALESDKEHGLGLGLSISRTIIEYHGGNLIVATSEPGRTIMAVRLRTNAS